MILPLTSTNYFTVLFFLQLHCTLMFRNYQLTKTCNRFPSAQLFIYLMKERQHVVFIESHQVYIRITNAGRRASPPFLWSLVKLSREPFLVFTVKTTIYSTPATSLSRSTTPTATTLLRIRPLDTPWTGPVPFSEFYCEMFHPANFTLPCTIQQILLWPVLLSKFTLIWSLQLPPSHSSFSTSVRTFSWNRTLDVDYIKMDTTNILLMITSRRLHKNGYNKIFTW